jgi:hypothetical protein
MNGSRVRIKALDYLIFFFALLIVALIAFQSYARGEGTPEVVISGADGQWIYALDAEATVKVPGPLGSTVVSVAGGSVQVLDSPCAEKICVRTGRISKPGQWIACLPNRVFVSIRGKKGRQADAISQ